MLDDVQCNPRGNNVIPRPLAFFGLRMALFPQCYILHVAQHTGQHLLPCMKPSTPTFV